MTTHNAPHPEVTVPQPFARSESLAEAYRRGWETARVHADPLSLTSALDVELAYIAGGLDALSQQACAEWAGQPVSADLIAAAPKLLAALVSLEQAYSNKHSPQHRAACLAEARAVIAMAMGEA